MDCTGTRKHECYYIVYVHCRILKFSDSKFESSDLIFEFLAGSKLDTPIISHAPSLIALLETNVAGDDSFNLAGFN